MKSTTVIGTLGVQLHAALAVRLTIRTPDGLRIVAEMTREAFACALLGQADHICLLTVQLQPGAPADVPLGETQPAPITAADTCSECGHAFHSNEHSDCQHRPCRCPRDHANNYRVR